MPATIALHVVDVAEIDPADPNDAVRWCLLTTHAVPDLAQAQQIIWLVAGTLDH